MKLVVGDLYEIKICNNTFDVEYSIIPKIHSILLFIPNGVIINEIIYLVKENRLRKIKIIEQLF